MKPWITSTLVITLALAQASATFAQRPQQRRPGERGTGRVPGGGRTDRAGSGTLERAGLKVGQQMPDVIVYDENGEKFPLSSVKGKHAVLVFGCLT
jgi:cytochrome oxidase Cu insertion factor (SCO1/SenC/PrrC family)